MVLYRTTDWVAFQSHAQAWAKAGDFSLHETVEGKTELRIRAGRLCFTRKFDPEDARSDEQQQILDEMLSFCRLQGFVKIEEVVQEEVFHA